jgi:chitodextrinase
VQNGNVSNVRVFDFEITDTEPSSFEGRIYGDNSENRPKYYDGTSWKAFLLDGDAAGTDSQTLSLSGTDLSISSGNTVDLSGVGGAAEYRNPDIHYVTRASGTDVTDAWFETTGEEGKRTINTSTSSNPAAPNFYEIATFSSNKSAILRSVLRGGSPLVLTSDDYNIIGSGTAVVDIDAGETDGVIGVYIDSLNAIQITKAPAALPSDVIIDGYFKPYSISQVTGLASSNITTTAFDISWDAATASVGTISNYEYSIDGGTPVAVTGATSASVTGLTESTAYNVNVRAVDAGGNKGQYSADLSVTTTSSFTPLWAANAATPTPNEVAGSAGFIDASNYTVSTVTSPTTNGTHAISITRTADGSSSADIGLQFQNLTIGQSYDFTFSIQITSGSPNNNYVRTNGTYSADWTVSDLVEYGTGNTGNWETYTLTMTPAVTNPRMRFNSSALAGVNTNGMVTLFDNLVITEN